MNNSNQRVVILEKLSGIIPVALGFLMPVFFLTSTTEFFEFNKLALLIVSTLALILLWTLRLLNGQKIQLSKASVDFPLLLFTAVIILSTIFSVNKTISLYGSQGRWFPSLFGVLTLVLFYYAATPNIKTVKHIKFALFSLLAGIFVSSFVSILSYFGIFLGSASYLRIVNFTFSGSVTTAVILSALGTVLSIALLTYEELTPVKIFLVLTTIVNFFYLVLTRQVVGWVVLVAGIAGILLIVNIGNLIKKRFTFIVMLGALLAIVLINVVPGTSEILRNDQFGTEISLPIQESWIVASSTIQNYPLLATGPSSFNMNFTRYKPLSINAEPTWTARFDKPQNELFNILATTGIVGIVAVLILGVRILKLVGDSIRVQDETGMISTAAIGLISLTPAFFFTYATVLNSFVYMYLLMLLVSGLVALGHINLAEVVSIKFTSLTSISSLGGDSGTIRKEYLHYVASLPLFALIGFAGYLTYRSYAAEYYMRQSVVAARNNLGTEIYSNQAKAINLHPGRDTYHNAYAQTNLALANSLASKPNLTDQEKQTIQNLIAQSIRSSRVATEIVNPLNVANWETRALIYRSLINVANNSAEWSVASYNTAIQLDPANPALRLNLGGVYYAAGDYLSAANLFRQATILKDDYANAHYNFAQALLRLNDYANAKRELEITRSLVAQGTADYDRVEQELTALANLPGVAGAQSEKPTVEEITGAEEKVDEKVQEPLTNPEEQEGIQGENLDIEALPERAQPNQPEGQTGNQQNQETPQEQPEQPEE